MMARRLLTGLSVLLLLSGSVLAEDRGYQVEVLVFTQDFPNTELFEQTSSTIDWPGGVSEVSDQQPAKHTTLDESLLLLSKDKHYRIIKYSAWTQALAADGVGTPVRIRSADGQLNGFLQLFQEQSLKVSVDLEYPSGLTDNTGNIILYRLNEKRPVKVDDVYYLDHPRLGAIVKITGP